MLSQIINCYLYPNAIPVFLFDESASVKQRYSPVYTKNLKIYRGVDNVVKFTVLNQEQKAYDLRTSTELTAATIPTGGSGKDYVATNVLQVAGGTSSTPATITVDTVSASGAILTYTILEPGVYTALPHLINNRVTGGAGTLAAFDLTFGELTAAEVQFNMLDNATRTVLFSKTATIVDAARGIISVTLDEGDVALIENEWCHFSLAYRSSPTASFQSMYVDDNHGVQGQAQILTGHYPDHRESIDATFSPSALALDASSPLSVTTPFPLPTTTPLHRSNVIFMDAGTKRNNTLHTVQLLFDETDPFTGTVAIEVSQDAAASFQTSPQGVEWAAATIVPRYVAQGASTYINFEGNYTAVRFELLYESGTMPTVLYRN